MKVWTIYEARKEIVKKLEEIGAFGKNRGLYT